MKAVEMYDNYESVQSKCRRILNSNGGRSFAKDVDFTLTEIARKYDIDKEQARELFLAFIDEPFVSPYDVDVKDALELKATDERLRAVAYCKKAIAQRIETARKNHQRKTCFTPTSTFIDGKCIDCTEELKEFFQRKNYGFVPTGYIGGVWQLTEDITW